MFHKAPLKISKFSVFDLCTGQKILRGQPQGIAPT